MPSEQLQIPTGDRKPSRIDDFLGIFPENVLPTGGFHLLERGGEILIIKSYSHGSQISDAHRRMFKQLVHTGENGDHPITIVCVWGMGPISRREAVLFDHQGESPKRVMTQAEFKEWLRRWWVDRSRR